MNVDPDGRSWLRNLFRLKTGGGTGTPALIIPPAGIGSPNLSQPIAKPGGFGNMNWSSNPNFMNDPGHWLGQFFNNTGNRISDFFTTRRNNIRGFFQHIGGSIIDGLKNSILWLGDNFSGTLTVASAIPVVGIIFEIILLIYEILNDERSRSQQPRYIRFSRLLNII